jgi:hypothetical protein
VHEGVPQDVEVNLGVVVNDFVPHPLDVLPRYSGHSPLERCRADGPRSAAQRDRLVGDVCESPFDGPGGEHIYVTTEKCFEVIVERCDIEQRPSELEVDEQIDVGVGSCCSLDR